MRDDVRSAADESAAKKPIAAEAPGSGRGRGLRATGCPPGPWRACSGGPELTPARARNRRTARGVEVEHLRARETPAPDLIEAKHLGLQALASWPHGSLAPQNHDLSFGGGDNARAHAAFGRRWLQWPPDLRPARTRPISDSASRRSSGW